MNCWSWAAAGSGYIPNDSVYLSVFGKQVVCIYWMKKSVPSPLASLFSTRGTHIGQASTAFYVGKSLCISSGYDSDLMVPAWPVLRHGGLGYAADALYRWTNDSRTLRLDRYPEGCSFVWFLMPCEAVLQASDITKWQPISNSLLTPAGKFIYDFKRTGTVRGTGVVAQVDIVIIRKSLRILLRMVVAI